MSSTSGFVGAFLGPSHAGGGVGGQDAYPGLQTNINTAGTDNKLALVNGTQTFASLTVPNDGNNHLVEVISSKDITTTEVGGAVTCVMTDAVSTHAVTTTLHAGAGTGPALQLGAVCSAILGPGSTVVIAQSTALTSGASVFSARVKIS